MTNQEIKSTIDIIKNMKPDLFRVSFKRKDGSVKETVMSEKSLNTWFLVSPDQILDFSRI